MFSHSPSSEQLLTLAGKYENGTKKRPDHQQRGHLDIVTSVTFCNDSKWVISCGNDGAVKIFDVESQDLIKNFRNSHKEPIYHVVVSQNQKFAASTSSDATVNLYSLETKELLRTFNKYHEQFDRALTFTSDSKYLVTVCRNTGLKLIALEDNFNEKEIPDVSNAQIISMASMKDPQLVMYIARDYSIRIFDIAAEKLLRTVKLPANDSVYWLKLSPDNKMVLVLAGSGTIMGFRLPSMRLVFKKPCLDPSGGMSASCTISKNNKTIYLISKNSIHVYDLMQRKTVKVYEGVSNDLILNLALSGDEKYLAVSSKDMTVRVIHLQDPTDRVSTIGVLPNYSIKRVCFAKKSNKVYFVSSNGCLGCIDRKKDKPIFINENSETYYLALALSPDEKQVLTGGKNSYIYVHRADNGEIIEKLDRVHTAQVSVLRISQDGSYLAAASFDWTISIYDFATKVLLHVSSHQHVASIRDLAFTRNSSLLSVSDRGRLSRFSPRLVQIVASEVVSDKVIRTIKLVHDEQMVIYSGLKGEISIADALTCQPLKRFDNIHNYFILAMSVFQIDPETYLVATASRDLSVGLHILKKLKMNTVAMLNNASEGAISEIQFDPSGYTIATGSQDSFINFYEIDKGLLEKSLRYLG